MKATTAHLVDKHGAVHGTHVFHDRNPATAVAHLNPAVRRASGGRYQYTLATQTDTDFLTRIEKLFETH